MSFCFLKGSGLLLPSSFLKEVVVFSPSLLIYLPQPFHAGFGACQSLKMLATVTDSIKCTQIITYISVLYVGCQQHLTSLAPLCLRMPYVPGFLPAFLAASFSGLIWGSFFCLLSLKYRCTRGPVPPAFSIFDSQISVSKDKHLTPDSYIQSSDVQLPMDNTLAVLQSLGPAHSPF